MFSSCPRILTYPLCFLTSMRYISKRIGWSIPVILKSCTPGLQLNMSQIFGVRKFFAQKLLLKINRKCRRFLGQTVKCDLHQYRVHTMGAYVRAIDAKSTFVVALLVEKFEIFRQFFSGKTCDKATNSVFRIFLTIIKAWK